MKSISPLIIPSKKRLDWLDFLRGAAISMVLVVHTTQATATPSILTPLFLQGARGVQLFFVISGFTMLLSVERKHYSESHRWITFGIRRILRIVPLFWIVTASWLFVHHGTPNYWAPEGVSPVMIILTFLFLQNWVFAHGGMPPGGVSISSEMNMYALVPYLRKVIPGAKQGFLWFAASLVFGCALSIAGYLFWKKRYPYENLVEAYFNSYWLPVAIPSFIAGFLVYRLLEKGYLTTRLAGGCLACGLIYCILLAYTPLHLKALFYAPGLGAIVLGFGFLFNHVHFPWWLCWPGKVSYSAFFIHFAIIEIFAKWISTHHWILSFALVFTLTILAATCSYYLLEIPFMKLGRLLTRKVEQLYANSSKSARFGPSVNC